MGKKKSIVTEYEGISAFSGFPAECQHHLCFGNGLRKLSDEDGLYIPLTHSEHNMGRFGIHGHPAAEKLSKMLGQMAWEKEYLVKQLPEGMKEEAREQFRKRYGISYL